MPDAAPPPAGTSNGTPAGATAAGVSGLAGSTGTAGSTGLAGSTGATSSAMSELATVTLTVEFPAIADVGEPETAGIPHENPAGASGSVSSETEQV